MQKTFLISKGSSLLEALITVSIVCIGTLSVMYLQTKLIRSTSIASQSSQAIELANEKMEQLRTFTNDKSFLSITSSSDNIQDKTTSFKRTWSVTEHSSPNYKEVSLNIIWPKQDGSTGSFTINSQVAYYLPSLSGSIMQIQSTPSVNLIPPTPTEATSMSSSSDQNETNDKKNKSNNS